MKRCCLSCLLLRDSSKPEQLPGREDQIPWRSAQELPLDSQGLQIRPGPPDVPQGAAVTSVLKGKGTRGQPALFGPQELSDQTYRKALGTASWSSSLPGSSHWLHWTHRVSPLEVTSSATAVADLFNPNGFLSVFLSCCHSGLLAEGCARQQLSNMGEGENRKELGKNSWIALVSVNSCVGRMKPCFKRDLLGKLVWGSDFEDICLYEVFSCPHRVIESQGWAGRCLDFSAKFMRETK